MSAFRIVPAGDAALVVEFEARIDPSVNARAIQLAEALQTARVPGVPCVRMASRLRRTSSPAMAGRRS